MSFLTQDKLTIVGAAGMIEHGSDSSHDVSDSKHLSL